MNSILYSETITIYFQKLIFSSRAGLGYYMLRVKNGYMLDKVFACVLMIIFWSILLNLGVSLLEKILFPHLRKGER